MRLAVLPLPFAALIVASLAACHGKPEAEHVLERHGHRLPFEAPVFDLLLDDIDGDGRTDLALTTHNQNYTQVFLQQGQRHFVASPPIHAVGFHPGNFIRLQHLADGERRYLMSAEGEDQLRLFAPDSAGLLRQVGYVEAPQPRYTTEFRWPSGPGLAISPFGSPRLVLAKGLDLAGTTLVAPQTIKLNNDLASLGPLIAADLTGDGVQEIVLPDGASRSVSLVRAPSGAQDPAVETVWRPAVDMLFDHVLVADYDQDGDLDLLVPEAAQHRGLPGLPASSQPRPPYIQMLVNDGTGQFTAGPRISFPPGGKDGKTAWSIPDIDFAVEADGTPYLLASSDQGLALMRLDQANLDQPPAAKVIASGQSGAAAKVRLFDLDGDGALDAILGHAGSATGAFVLYGPLWESFTALSAAGAQLLPARSEARQASTPHS